MSSNPDRVFRTVFGVSCAFLAVLVGFVCGIVMMQYKVWPYQALQTAKGHVGTYLMAGQWAPEKLLVLAPPRASRERVVVHQPTALMPGYRAIMGWDTDAERYAVWLFNDQGQHLHSWPIDYKAIDLDGPSNGTDMPHGLYVFEDGSILVNFDQGDIMARLDACGEPIWVRKGIFHHSIERADDGTFWTWRAADSTSAYSHFQYLVNFRGDTGAILNEYSLIDDLLKTSSLTTTIFGIPPDYEYQKANIAPENKLDVFHPNDIEPLPSELAPRFPNFRAGDLLISLRDSNLVAILDPIARKVKWWSHGPWRTQHDPDFGPDGKIWVYDNNGRGERSQLIGIDPGSRRIQTAFSNDELAFYSESMGKHQRLPNNTTIIVSPDEGRVLETLWSGDMVFEFNNIADQEFNAHVENAVWLPENFFRSLPSCQR